METQRVDEGSGLKEIGAVPEDWRIVRLGDIADFTKKRARLDLSKFERIPFIPMEMIPIGGLHIEGYLLKSPSEISSGVYCEKGDILLPKITPSFENGKQAIVSDIPYDFAIATTEVYPIKMRAETDRLFLFYFLMKPDVRKIIAAKMEGTTGRKRVPRDVVGKFPVPFPSPPERQRIAFALSRFQQAMDQQGKVIEATRSLKKSLMQKLFTEGIGHIEFKDSELGQIPKSWQVVKLDDTVSLAQYGLSVKGNREGPYPIIRMNNLEEGGWSLDDLQYVSLDGENFRHFRLAKGDILFNRTNSIDLVGKTSLFELDGDFVFASYLIRLKARSEMVLPELLNHYMNWSRTQQRLKSLATRAVGQSNISATRLGTLLVSLPPITEQLEVASTLRKVSKKIEVEEKRKTSFRHLFRTMLNKLMSGEIRVKDLDLGVRNAS